MKTFGEVLSELTNEQLENFKTQVTSMKKIRGMKATTVKEDKQPAVDFEISRFEPNDVLLFTKLDEDFVSSSSVGRTSSTVNTVFCLLLRGDMAPRLSVFYLSSLTKMAIEASEAAVVGVKATQGQTYNANYENFDNSKKKTNVREIAECFMSQRYLGKALIELNTAIKITDKKQVRVRNINDATKTSNSTLMNMEFVGGKNDAGSLDATQIVAELKKKAESYNDKYAEELVALRNEEAAKSAAAF